MDRDYKIEVCMTPSTDDNLTHPYFWVLFAYHSQWCNEGAGWAETPEKAWNDAFDFFKRVTNPIQITL